MKITVLNTKINDVAIRCEWDSLFGQCNLILGSCGKQAQTLGGRIRRKIQTTLNLDAISLEFVPFHQGKQGLFILKKNGVLYKAAGISLLTFETIKVSDLPISEL